MTTAPDGTDDTIVAGDVQDTPTVGGVFAGRYLIEREIGRGGMGTVFAALDRTLDDRVALKVLDAPPGHDASTVERFRREVRLARRVTHRNTARTYDIGEHGGLHYLTMELVDGVPLERLIRDEGRMEVARAAEIGRQLCEGLAAAHAAGVVHRDLKPANVLIQSDGRVVITDFGIARSVADDARLTLDGGGLVGTPAYMAPEQVSGGDVDARTDVYALGLMLFEMLTGRLPFEAKTPLSAAVARLQQDPPSPAAFEAMPEPLAQLVLLCLARAPDERIATAHDVALQLLPYAEPEAAISTSVGRRTGDTTQRNVTPKRFATTATGERSLAVLPFSYRGPQSDAYFAEALSDELIDLLSMTKGLKVPSHGAIATLQGNEDPHEVGTRLSVEAIVSGTVQRAGNQIRISARLIDTSTGYQTWTEKFGGQLEDVFELQDRLAKRIVETLRLELQTHQPGTIAPEAIELYLRARTRMHDFTLGGVGPDGAVALFERCLELAPDFQPARAAYAAACLIAWFLPQLKDQRDWAAAARRAVADAIEHAPDLAETHLASARLSVQDGRYRDAVRSLSTALRIAPTYASAHQHLGSLHCEAGRVDEGIRHIMLAAELDPTDIQGRLALGRVYGIRGEIDRFDELLIEMRKASPQLELPISILELRVRCWHGDLERARAAAESFSAEAGPEGAVLASVFLGETSPDVLQTAAAAQQVNTNPRFVAMAAQMAAEAAGVHGHDQLALTMARHAASGVLVDLYWLEQCPVLRGVRALPEYADLHRLVRARAEGIW